MSDESEPPIILGEVVAFDSEKRLLWIKPPKGGWCSPEEARAHMDKAMALFVQKPEGET